MALKTLHTLVKLHKRRVDVLRREMQALEEERKQLEALAQRLKEEHAREMQLASDEPRVAGFFGSYSKRIKERQAAIAAEIVKLDAAIAAKAEAIRAEFGEQKKYEIAREHAEKKLAEAARHQLQQRFDEIGVQQYTRAKDHHS